MYALELRKSRSITEPLIDELNGFPEKNRIISADRFSMEDLKEQFKALKYIDTAEQEVATSIFYPRSKLEKPTFYLQTVGTGNACFSYQTAPSLTNPPRFMEKHYSDQSFALTFREKGFNSELDSETHTIVKTFGQSGWYHSSKPLSLISQIGIYCNILFKGIAIGAPVIVKHVLGIILNLFKRILCLQVPQRSLTLRQKLTLAYTENDLPNQTRNERVAQNLPPVVPVTEAPVPT